MVVDLDVDATLGDGFYYCCCFLFSKRIRFYDVIFTFFLKKSYKWMWDLRTLAYFQGSEMFPHGIRPWAVLSVKNFFSWRSPCPSTFGPPNSNPKRSTWHSNGVPLFFPLKGIRWRESPEARPGDQGLLSSSRSWGDTWTRSLLADFLTFNPRQYE